MTTESGPGRATLGAIALSFLKLGTLAFGGPAVHIAMMEEEFVRRRGWLTPQEFLDRLGAATLIPGPSSTEMAIYIGQNQRGGLGLIVAGCCFILPAAILVCAIAAAYVRFGAVPQVAGVLYALKPVVIAVVLQALWKLARSAVKTRLLGAIGILAAVAFALGIYDLLVLAGAGLCAAGPAISERLRKTQGSSAITLFALKLKSSVLSLAAISGLAAAPFSLGRLFLTFLKIGSVLFGSGYVLLAFLRADFVLRLRWLTERQLLDAVAVGQITPGPVFTTATFIGYLLGGTRGAIAATVGIFLPGISAGRREWRANPANQAIGNCRRRPRRDHRRLTGPDGRRHVATRASRPVGFSHHRYRLRQRGVVVRFRAECRMAHSGRGVGRRAARSMKPAARKGRVAMVPVSKSHPLQ